MHPSPPSSIHLHSAPRTSIYFHQAHFSIHPALCNTLNIITTKILHVIGQFPQIQTKKIKVVHLVWKLAHMVSWRYILIPDSGLDFWNHNHKIHFWVNLGWKSQSCPFYLIIGIYTRYFKDADSYSDISFLNFQPYIHFWANLGWKNLTCLFCLKVGTYGILDRPRHDARAVSHTNQEKRGLGRQWKAHPKVKLHGLTLLAPNSK